MALESVGGDAGRGVAFLVSAGLMYEAIAAACSSPQTTEINASKRSGTLMKWVYLGLGQGALLVTLAAIYQPAEAGAILAGGTIAAGLMYFSYLHAREAGLAAVNLPGTES